MTISQHYTFTPLLKLVLHLLHALLNSINILTYQLFKKDVPIIIHHLSVKKSFFVLPLWHQFYNIKLWPLLIHFLRMSSMWTLDFFLQDYIQYSVLHTTCPMYRISSPCRLSSTIHCHPSNRSQMTGWVHSYLSWDQLVWPSLRKGYSLRVGIGKC